MERGIALRNTYLLWWCGGRVLRRQRSCGARKPANSRWQALPGRYSDQMALPVMTTQIGTHVTVVGWWRPRFHVIGEKANIDNVARQREVSCRESCILDNSGQIRLLAMIGHGYFALYEEERGGDGGGAVWVKFTLLRTTRHWTLDGGPLPRRRGRGQTPFLI